MYKALTRDPQKFATVPADGRLPILDVNSCKWPTCLCMHFQAPFAYTDILQLITLNVFMALRVFALQGLAALT